MTSVFRKENTLLGPQDIRVDEGCWWNKNVPWNILSFSLGIFIPVAIPVLNMLVLDTAWGPFKKPVNRWKCNCHCFDTIFRGLCIMNLKRSNIIMSLLL